MSKLKILFVAIPLVALSIPASADTVSDSLVVTDDSGHVVASVTATEDQELTNGSGFVYIIPDSNRVDPTQFGNATQVLEPGGISDVFGLAQGVSGCPGAYCLAFSSDTETTPVSFTGAPNTIPSENGGTFDATMYLDFSDRNNGFHATFTSDADVPEPSSLILVATGLIATLLCGRNRLALGKLA